MLRFRRTRAGSYGTCKKKKVQSVKVGFRDSDKFGKFRVLRALGLRTTI